MPETSTVVSSTAVTPARFAEGLSYADFLSQATINHDKFNESYASVPLTEEDIAFFRKAAALSKGLAKIIALAEAWCGDVYRELPTIVRIAEATGVELRIFLRDQNADIMDEFLSNGGKSRAIPVFAFYTADLHYIAHFTERSASAHAGLTQAMDEAKAELNLARTATFGNLSDADRAAFLRAVIAKIEPRLNQWRKDAIAEIRSLLSVALGIPNAV
jgi:hypothetical protein